MREIEIRKSRQLFGVIKNEWNFGRTRNAVGTRAAVERFHSSFFELVLPNFH